MIFKRQREDANGADSQELERTGFKLEQRAQG